MTLGSLIYRFRARGYNAPTHFAMFVSQWAHQMFLWDIWSYKTYVKIQTLAYRLFNKEC